MFCSLDTYKTMNWRRVYCLNLQYIRYNCPPLKKKNPSVQYGKQKRRSVTSSERTLAAWHIQHRSLWKWSEENQPGALKMEASSSLTNINGQSDFIQPETQLWCRPRKVCKNRSNRLTLKMWQLCLTAWELADRLLLLLSLLLLETLLTVGIHVCWNILVKHSSLLFYALSCSVKKLIPSVSVKLTLA